MVFTIRKRKVSLVVLISIILTAVLLIYGMITGFAEETEDVVTGYVTGDHVRVRTGPSTEYDILMVDGYELQLSTNHELIILGEEESAGTIWYNIKFDYNGNTYQGFMHGGYVAVRRPFDEVAFRLELQELGFPESYIEPLVELKRVHTNWKFVPQKFELEWSTMVDKQTTGVYSLAPKNSISSWKSLDYGYFDWDTNTWMLQDTEQWVKASDELVEYYLDPRNFINDTGIFQFEMISYDSQLHNIEGVEAILKGTFMENKVVQGDPENRTYAQIFMHIAKTYGYSPYYIAGKVRLEQGTAGDSALISGTYPGYEGYYNYYNAGASGTGATTVVVNGLKYAKAQGWNSQYNALVLGAQKVFDAYISRGQDTSYLTKFDAISIQNGGYPKQYMQSIQGAESEAKSLKQAYSKTDMIKNAFVFKIPVYTNMPEVPTPIPTKDGNPNYKLKSLAVEGFELSPTFDRDVYEYGLIVDYEISSINILAEMLGINAVIDGAGKRELAVGENQISVKVTAENGDIAIYKLIVHRKENNPSYLAHLGVDDYALTPYFETDIFEYTLEVPFTQEKVVISARPEIEATTVTGTGEKVLAVGENVFEIKTKTAEGLEATYKITITRLNDVVCDMPHYSFSEDFEFVYGFMLGQTAADVKNEIKVTNGSFKLVDKNGAELLDTAIVATGQKIQIFDTTGALKTEVTICIFGDINGDGKINVLDYVYIQRYLWKQVEYTKLQKFASDVNHSGGEINLLDKVYIMRYNWRMVEISQARVEVENAN